MDLDAGILRSPVQNASVAAGFEAAAGAKVATVAEAVFGPGLVVAVRSLPSDIRTERLPVEQLRPRTR